MTCDLFACDSCFALFGPVEEYTDPTSAHLPCSICGEKSLHHVPARCALRVIKHLVLPLKKVRS